MRSRPLPKIALSLLCAAVVASACSGSSDESAGTPSDFEPLSIENCGFTVEIDEPIERAFGISQPAIEILLALGLEDRMVATAGWNDDVLPELEEANEQVPVLTRDFPAFEAVLEQEPDFVYSVFDWAYTDEGVAPRERFEEFDVPTYLSESECGGQDAEQSDVLSLDDLYDEINEISLLFGVPERGEDLVAELRGRAEEAIEDLGADDVTLAWWYSATRTPYIAGCCGAPGIITRAVGAQNAFDDSRQLWPEISWETVADRDPTVLILADLSRGDDGDLAQDKIDFLESNPVTREMDAVQNQRYVILSGTDMDPGIRNVSAIETIAEGLRDLGVVE